MAEHGVRRESAMKMSIELDEGDIRNILADYIHKRYGADVLPGELPIQAQLQYVPEEWGELFTNIRVKVEIVR
jgi:hypothetical protein